MTEPTETPQPQDRRRTGRRITLALCGFSLALSAGILGLGLAMVRHGDSTIDDRFAVNQVVTAIPTAYSFGGWTRNQDFRALPEAVDDWQRTDYIGAAAVADGIRRLAGLMPRDAVEELLDAPDAERTAAVYARPGEIFMVLIDRGGGRADRHAHAHRTFLGDIDFRLLGARGKANINLLATFGGAVSLSVLGKVEPSTLDRFMARANLSVLGVDS